MTDLLGKQLKQYRITALLGEGGMGAVYRGWDENLARTVAIKVMHPQFARQDEFRRRFMQEAKAPARLSHPSIVHIYDFGSSDGILYLVMEFIPGKTLSTYIQQAHEENRIIHLKETLVILSQVADALDYAHRNGVIHRDIKPDNIMLRTLDRPDREGDPPLRAGVTDFGLVKMREGGVQTQTGAFLGTLPYMAPEQCLGLSIDGRTDVYSLGVVLYRLTTGRLPLDIKTPTDAIIKHQNETPPPPRSLRPGIPFQVERIIQRAIAKKPEERYATAGDFYTDLRHAADRLSTNELSQFSPPETTFSLITQPQDNHEEPPEFDFFAAKAREIHHHVENRLHILAADQTMRSILLKPGNLTLGRGKDNDLVLDDPQASRNHARLDFNGQRLTVTDLKSTNGTFLDEARLLPGVSEPWYVGQILHIGKYHFRFELSQPAADIDEDAHGTIPAEPSPQDSLISPISVSVDNTAFTFEPGIRQSLHAKVFNQGSIVDHFRLSIVGLPYGWKAADPKFVQLLPNQQDEVDVILTPPPPEVPAGTFPARLQIASQVSAQDAVYVDLSLEVIPKFQYKISLKPEKQRSVGSATFTIDVANQSNTPIQVNLSADDPLQACIYEFTPAWLNLAPHQSASVRLQVSPRQPQVLQQTEIHRFTISSQLDNYPTAAQQITGEWERTAPALTMKIDPARQGTPGSCYFSVQLINESPIDLVVECTASENQQMTRLLIQPEKLLVPAGSMHTARLSLDPKGAQPGQTYLISVTAIQSGTRLKLAQETAEWTMLRKEQPATPAPAQVMPAPQPIAQPAVQPAAQAVIPPAPVVTPPVRPIDLPEPVALNRIMGCLPAGLLVLFLCILPTGGAGIFAGNQVSMASGDEVTPWIAAIIVWIIGLVISVNILRRLTKVK
jgi:serine/threonine protein kinase